MTTQRSLIDDLRRSMKIYRKDLIPLPTRYIELHREAAEATLTELTQRFGLRVLTTEMVSDGWFDGMKVLRVIAEDRAGKLRDVRWSDANGGSWFEQREGQSLLWVPDDRPGFM